MGRSIVALASAVPAPVAVIRLAGADAFAIAHAAGVPVATDGRGWSGTDMAWPLGPLRVLTARGPGTFTGTDTVELLLPGAPDLVDLALARLGDAGAQPAQPGAFTRLALAHGRLTLDRAEALLALVHAADAPAAARALERLRGRLGEVCGQVRERLIDLRAKVEAGLDFAEEPDVRSYDAAALRGELAHLGRQLAAFQATGEDLGRDPVVVLAGPANAGKSALFAALTGAPALISPVAGTTRDHLEAPWDLGGRQVRLVDTAGWLRNGDALDAAAVDRGRQTLAGAALILACSAPDAPLPGDHGLEPGRTLVLATKSDAGRVNRHYDLAVSTTTGHGLADLTDRVRARLAGTAPEDARIQGLLIEATGILGRLARDLPADELLADDLGQTSHLLGAIVGTTTTDDVLAAVFQRFCIGK